MIESLIDIEKHHNRVVKYKVPSRDTKPMWLLISEMVAVSKKQELVTFRSDISVKKEEVLLIYNHMLDLELQNKELVKKLFYKG